METPSVLISSGLHGERGSRRTTVEGGRMAGAYKRIKKPYFTCRLVVKDEKEGEGKVLPGQEDDACDSFCDVCEISCGVITENEWKKAVKDDVELTEGEICGILPPLPRAAGLHGDAECVDLERSPRRARESENDGEKSETDFYLELTDPGTIRMTSDYTVFMVSGSREDPGLNEDTMDRG
ncbi:hypothetical protein NDU88_000189 [Pleurodeles waltl]|uniref:Uncharacterized protein n=1 Tax=Pleurodeles waltl TaxID=8319 RepID=A0AAV7L7U0_PLEWA|nr:hypothetical protein NDU88_000189 [Pleurodeles waltl]